jgi:GTP-binding protein
LNIAAEFVTSAAGAGDFPRDRIPEVALVGRSNVGKSSLINALVRKPLARTSAAPGKTRLANFYRVQRGSAPACYLVDLPGYGYARGLKGRGPRGSAPQEPDFNRLADEYFARCGTDLHGPPKEIGVILLVDSRHPGLESDVAAWEWVRSQPCPSGIIGTKADKLTQAERVRHIRELESLFETSVLLVSAQNGQGLEELWKLIARLPNRTAA